MVDTRRLVTLIKIICKQKNIKVDQYGNGWILQLTHQQKSKFVYGYKFPVDESTVQMLCDDKAGLSETLITNHIPCVDHQYVMSPMNWHNKTQISQPLSRAKKLLEIHKSIVIKPDKGTGGENVYKVNNLIELYAKSAIIFARYPALVFAPYYDIQHEYRIVLINQKVTLIYEKVKGKS
jgi:glutathione synthase/RimK-type ligase-like ATP-grasp enzyme